MNANEARSKASSQEVVRLLRSDVDAAIEKAVLKGLFQVEIGGILPPTVKDFYVSEGYKTHSTKSSLLGSFTTISWE